MRNPLHRRLPRELKHEFGKYLVIFLFMALTVGFISGFLVAGSSMIQAYDESFEKYNIEDGHFVLKTEAASSLLKRLEQDNITIYKDYYKEEETDTDGDGEMDNTLRFFVRRTEVNRECLMKGEFPVQKDEIAIDRMYADNNSLSVGDNITVAGKTLKVVGLVALSDYSALFSDNNDLMFDSIKFGVAIMSKEGFALFSDSGLCYSYEWKYGSIPKDTIEEKEWSEKFIESLAEETSRAEVEIEDVVPRYANQAIQFTGDDMGGDRSMMIVLLYIIIVIMAFVFSVTIRHTVVKEAAVIGTLRASGYTKAEIFWHYLTPPMIVTLLAAVVGNILGYTIFKDMVADLYYSSYSLPTYQTIWSSEAFVLTTVVPMLIMLVTNAVALLQKLQLSPLQFLRRDLEKKKKRKALRLPDFRFFTRFRIRVLLQNMYSYLTLTVGILFSCILLLFGMMMKPLLDHYQVSVVENMLADYQYVLKVPAETENKTAEKYCMTGLTYVGSSRQEDISVYGIQKGSRYFREELPEDGICISDAFQEKYKVSLGEQLKLRETYGTREYIFTVSKVVDYPGGLTVFMDDKIFRDTFELENDLLGTAVSYPELALQQIASPEDQEYFTGYFSDEKLTDIKEDYIEACITADDMTKISRQLSHSMGEMFEMINVFAVVLAAILIYLLTKLILERNVTSISMVKILGYENKEIARLYLLSTSWVVVLGLAVGLGLSTGVIVGIYRIFMMNYNGWLTCYFAPDIYPKMFVMVLAAYGVVLLTQFRKIQKIPMDEALKTVE